MQARPTQAKVRHLVFAATMAVSIALGGIGPSVLGTAHASELLQPSLGNGGNGGNGGDAEPGAEGAADDVPPAPEGPAPTVH